MKKGRMGPHQGSVLSPLLFAIVGDVVTENAKSVVNELLYADDLVLINETIEDLKESFWNWKDTPESKGLKVKTKKTSNG